MAGIVNMTSRQLFIPGLSRLTVCALLTLFVHTPALSQETRAPYVRLAELEIDPAQIENFKAAIKTGIEAAIRVEPGVLVLYAVSDKDNPAIVKVFEVYTDEEAYRTHRETAHFKTFLNTTKDMVRSRKLSDADPIVLGAKPK